MNSKPSCQPPIKPPAGAFCGSGHDQKKRLAWHISVGRHRVQLDSHELPAIQGQRGREYNISVIHLRTRINYAETHPTQTSAVIAGVLTDFPPFQLVVTDNGFLARSNRTDSEECFHRQQFVSSEERRYIHRWEMRYTTRRPHQGLGGENPDAVVCREYASEANIR